MSNENGIVDGNIYFSTYEDFNEILKETDFSSVLLDRQNQSHNSVSY